MDIIAILTLIITFCTLILSIHKYNQTYLIPKRIESIQNLVNIITNKIQEIKIENDENEVDTVPPLQYVMYTDSREMVLSIYENWERILEDFRYSSNYNFLIKPAKEEFDELLRKDFYTQLKSTQNLVLKLEAKRKILLKLNETILKNSDDTIVIRLLNWIYNF